jgi:hypothetical protein
MNVRKALAYNTELLNGTLKKFYTTGLKKGIKETLYKKLDKKCLSKKSRGERGGVHKALLYL